jgi:hypothetical protein
LGRKLINLRKEFFFLSFSNLPLHLSEISVRCIQGFKMHYLLKNISNELGEGIETCVNCEHERWLKVTHDHVQWLVLVLAVSLVV